MNRNIERAQLLLERGRPELAEKEARTALIEDPESPYALAMLSLALLGQEKNDEAYRTAKTAVSSAPDWDYGLFVLSSALLGLERHDEALDAIDRALEIDPEDADFWARRAHILIHQEKLDEALLAANNGLEVDPEDVDCANLRSLCLQSLGRVQEAGEAAKQALRSDPGSAFAHANSGWACLRRGDHRQAEKHFREALRLEPDFEWAREGVITSLKARSPIYRGMLKYFFWMSNLGTAMQWVVVIGIIVGRRVLRSISENLSGVPQFIVMALGVVLVAFVLLTWIADPLANFFLLVHPFGRLALRRRERAVALVVGALLLSAIGLLFGSAATLDLTWAYVAAGVAAYTIPVSSGFSGSSRTLAIGAVAIGIVGVAALGAFVVGSELAGPLTLVYILAVLAFTWLGGVPGRG